MLAPQNSLTRDDMETRRLAAAGELLNGVTQSQVARRYGVSRTTASRWHRSIVVKGVDGMRKRRATGRPSRLTADQVDSIRIMYCEGARFHGFSTDRWTTGKLAEAIERAKLPVSIEYPASFPKIATEVLETCASRIAHFS